MPSLRLPYVTEKLHNAGSASKRKLKSMCEGNWLTTNLKTCSLAKRYVRKCGIKSGNGPLWLIMEVEDIFDAPMNPNTSACHPHSAMITWIEPFRDNVASHRLPTQRFD